MKDDQISRQAALDCFHCWIDRNGDVCTPDDMPEYRAIEALPPAEPERKKGKWLMAGEDEREQIVWVECSECGQALSWNSNYCPNCGAKMER